jgi:hypothetical protein
MMVELQLPAPVDVCYRQFCDVAAMRLWLPDLKKLKVVRSDVQGRPLEVTFSVGETLTYALVYAYDDDTHKVRWVPSAGVRDGVSGFAQFEAQGDGCRFTYSLDSQRGRGPGHPESVAEAFVEWIRKSR